MTSETLMPSPLNAEETATSIQNDVPFSGHVTVRSFVIGLLLSGGLAALNSWIENYANVHFLGGVQMPFGAIFSLLVLVLFVNLPLKRLQRGVSAFGRILPPLSTAELLTTYVMMLFASLISTPGADNFFLTTGTTLFYFTTRENGWADLFYSYIPQHFAPGWDGNTFQANVIEPLYQGGLEFNQIPWHAWTLMLTAWGVLLTLVYSTLFFGSLILRKQWIESEALAFPLVQLPLQMVEGAGDGVPPAASFWADRTMWAGVALAGGFHVLRGMNNYFPDWPTITAFQGNTYYMDLTEYPWSSAGTIGVEFFFGAIGIAYLLTREVSFSFWVFFLLFRWQLVLCSIAGYPAASLPKDTFLGRPLFITNQSIGGWMMMGAILLWTARNHLRDLARAALRGGEVRDEPFSPRVVLSGFVLSVLGVFAWCVYSGINPLATIFFLGIYAVTSLVLARLVVEGGFMFPQTVFSPLEMLTGTMMGASSIGAASLTKLSFVQPVLFADMRTNLLPAFLHTLKVAHDIRLDRKNTRRILVGCVLAIIVSWCVSNVVTLATIYKTGGLNTYTWFTTIGGQGVFKGTATMLKADPQPSLQNWGWMGVGAGIVWALTAARARFLWFPLHPLAYLVAGSYPITRLWPSFFLGWLIKFVLLRFGGQDWANRARPFMIGLILGNAAAMVLWMILGFYLGTQIKYWPA